MNKTFLIRFCGYFLTLAGLLAVLFQFGPVAAAELNYRKDRLFNVRYSVEGSTQARSFGQINSSQNTNAIQPVSTDYGLVVEKINANARVIAGVDPSDQAAYTSALAKGVAEALGSTPPGQPGNLYLFSHSAGAAWDIARYNAIFYLLRELGPGDRVVIFYKGVRYDYIVFDKVVVPPSEISYLTNRYDKPVLTLQTCDPPGTTLNRLIVRAKLVGS